MKRPNIHKGVRGTVDVTCWVTPATEHPRIYFWSLSVCTYIYNKDSGKFEDIIYAYHHRSTPSKFSTPSRINALRIFSIFFWGINTSCAAPSACSKFLYPFSYTPLLVYILSPYISLLRRIFSSRVHPFAVCYLHILSVLCIVVSSQTRPAGGIKLVGLWSIGFQSVGLLRVDWARSSIRNIIRRGIGGGGGEWNFLVSQAYFRSVTILSYSLNSLACSPTCFNPPFEPPT